MKAFDCNQILSYDDCIRMKNSGYDAAIRYVGRYQQASFDLFKEEVANITKSGLKLGVVQHCPNPGWICDKALGDIYGANAVKFAQEAGYKEGCIIYLDLEGLSPLMANKKADIIAFCNAWYDQVVKVYTPGIYVGYDTFLTGDDLYYTLKFQHYWSSFSQVPMVTKRGYEMYQKLEIVLNGIQLDPDEIPGDNLKNFPVFMEPAIANEKILKIKELLMQALSIIDDQL